MSDTKKLVEIVLATYLRLERTQSVEGVSESRSETDFVPWQAMLWLEDSAPNRLEFGFGNQKIQFHFWSVILCSKK